MALALLGSACLPLHRAPRRAARRSAPERRSTIRAQASSDEPLSTLDSGLLVAGAISAPVSLWSEWTLFQTGCGLPPGPGGVLGALEGVSYLAIVAFIAASLQRKTSTGTGLPAGPGGALGAVEGIVYLAALAGLGVAGFTIAQTGGLPSPLPDGGACF